MIGEVANPLISTSQTQPKLNQRPVGFVKKASGIDRVANQALIKQADLSIGSISVHRG
jgi:N-acetylmuramic acid 6-phosphate (MurNAc-6-P) etherase